MDTIFALATAPGRAGVSVIRVSGPEAFASLSSIAKSTPSPRTAGLTTLTNTNAEVLDQALILTFPGPGSFTGEDVVEYHTHGSVAVVEAVQRELATHYGHRRAEAGEFTRRALMNGKMDLTQVEGLADLIEAQTEVQRQQAQQVVSGAFASFVSSVRHDIVRAAALLEAAMDFADEEVPVDVTPEVVALLDKSVEQLNRHIEGYRFSERVRSGFEVAIVGEPNVGKSTLLNALAGREASITSVYAGTTRDIVEVQMNLDGIPVTILDTAGLRKTEDHVEKLGIERARSRAESADLRILLVEQDVPDGIKLMSGDLKLHAKADTYEGEFPSVSGSTGLGLDALVSHVTSELGRRVQKAGLATRHRHFEDMKRSLIYIAEAKSVMLGKTSQYDIAAEELRSARHALGSIVGHVDVENLLDVIFSSFCIGK